MTMNPDPKISLGIDNCFAAKRYTRPRAWMDLIRDMGLTQVEASADTECDPLYQGEEYIKGWIQEVRRQSEATGVQVVNLYSGHGTYCTLGLAHTDEGARLRFRDKWLKAQINTASALHANMGFFAHSFDDEYLQDVNAYRAKLEELYANLILLAEYAGGRGLRTLGLEQMYTPNMPPWTIESAKTFLFRVWGASETSLYLTVDLGHMNGQQYFQRPTREQIAAWIAARRAGQTVKRVWVGSKWARSRFEATVREEYELDTGLDIIEEEMRRTPHLFAKPEDCSVTRWVEELGAYSPIIHLQQSDGRSSPHWPFDAEHNAAGIIRGEDVFRALGVAYETEREPGMPDKAEEIVMTLEPFIATAGNFYDLIDEITESVAYWRTFVPRDGMRLSEILKNLRA